MVQADGKPVEATNGHPVTAETRETRGERILDYIFDDIDREMNPTQEDCWHCGGEGYTFDCFDGCCADADVGCEQCTERCPECRLYEAKRKRLIREEVIKSNDVDVAIAWLKYTNRWHDSFTDEQVMAQLAAAAEKLQQPTAPR